jgi:hypothetical protein
MSAAGRAEGGKSNWAWAAYFWLTLVVFAVIGGISEMWVYYAFEPPSEYGWQLAFARAFVTQAAVVGFSAAGVKSYQLAGGGWRGILAAIPANTVALFFAFVTFWMMRITTVAFRQDAILGAADSQPLSIPGLATLPGPTTTVIIVAGVSFFQWALGVFGPIIVSERRQMTAEEIRLKGEAAVAQAEINLRLGAVRGQGVGQMVGGVWKGLKVATSATQTSQVSGAPSGGLRVLKPGDSQPLDAGTMPTRGMPKGPWNVKHILRYIALEYPGVDLSEPAALEYMKQSMKARLKGTQYMANILAVKAWARRTYGAPLSEQRLGESQEVAGAEVAG